VDGQTQQKDTHEVTISDNSIHMSHTAQRASQRPSGDMLEMK